MSASGPNGSPSKAAVSVALPRRRRKEKDRGVWFLVSVVLHALALAALIHLTPVRQLVADLQDRMYSQPTMSAVGLTELAEAMESLAAEQIEGNAQELLNVLGEMGGIQDGMFREFAAFERQRRDSAPQDALKEMEKAVERMNSAVEAIEQGAPVEATDRFQALAEQAQQRARKKLEMIGFDVETVSAVHRTAEGTHLEAKLTHDRHTQVKARIPLLEQALVPQRATAEALGKQVQQLKDSEKPTPTDQIERQAERLALQEQLVGDREEALDAVKRQQAELEKEEPESQRRAIAAQEVAAATLREAIEEQQRLTAGGGGPRRSDVAFGGTGPPRAGRPVAERPDGRQGIDVAWLYGEARRREDSIAETFKEVRAMDLAMVRDMKLEDARNDIDVVRPVRPDLDADLLRDAVRTDERFEEHREELRTALRESTSMVNLAYRMLEMATESVDKMKFGSDVGVGDLWQSPDFQLIIRELAMEDVSGDFADLAALMQALEEEGEEEGEEGDEGRARRADFQDLTAGLRGGLPAQFGLDGFGSGGLPELAPDVEAVGARKISPYGWPGKWMFIDTWYTLGPFPNPNRINIDREFPPDSLIDLDAVYVGKDGRTIRWQFVQSDTPEVVPTNAEPYGIWYAYTEFYCDRPRDVLLAMGTDDRGMLKINGVPVWISSKLLKGWSIAEVWRRVHLSKGVNRMLYRVENGWQHIAFSVVLRLEDQPQD